MLRKSVFKMYDEMMKRALDARDLPRERRRYGLHTVTIDKEQVSELHDLIQEFEDNLDNLTYKARQHDELAAVLLAAFPLLKDVY